ncbi:MAG: dTDP-4-dehydrorhamnose reductase [Muribaculaceae bacterium]|nr:dTDP-4-dehydrorhamnose reductase [Muribaculaceae bacterium]
MRILVTGGNGQLGKCIRDATTDSTDTYIFTDVDDFDITDPEAVDLMLRCNDFQVIVNCAAFTDVNAAESKAEIAEQINAEAVGYIAEAAKKYGVFFIQISTDYVFGGNINNTPCDENQQPNPTGVYGLTKLHGEEAIRKSGCRYMIIRTAWLYSRYGKNFVKTMISLTASKPEISVVIDQAGTPTYAPDLARAIVEIISRRLFEQHDGIYHYSNEGVCSWYDFATAIGKLAGNDGCNVLPCRSDEFPSPVRRPSYSVLDKTKIKQELGIRVPYWMDSLSTCIKEIKSDEA